MPDQSRVIGEGRTIIQTKGAGSTAKIHVLRDKLARVTVSHIITLTASDFEDCGVLEIVCGGS